MMLIYGFVFADSCVHLTDKWVELVICGFVNHCTDLELTSQASLDLLHGICMGMDSLEKGSANRFMETDFIINWKTDNPEPRLVVCLYCYFLSPGFPLRTISSFISSTKNELLTCI